MKTNAQSSFSHLSKYTIAEMELNMSFKVSLVDRAIWDEMEVFKIIEFPFARDAYKPFSQARICIVAGSNITFRVWSFEAKPRIDSLLAFLLNPFKSSSSEYIKIIFKCDKTFEVYFGDPKSGIEKLKINDDEIIMTPFEGEDLQGIYWGGEVTITKKLLFMLYGKDTFINGDIMSGNIYKYCLTGEKNHFGTLFPVTTPEPEIDAPQCFGDFLIVNY